MKTLVEAYLDLENTEIAIGKLSDEKIADRLLTKFNLTKKDIGFRLRSCGSVGISHDTKSVNLYHQAKDLYCLGYFESAIMVCRSTAEYLAAELFKDKLNSTNIKENEKELIVESIDFRKIISFLFPDKKDEVGKDFHKIYDIGNNYIHPKRDDYKVEEDAQKTIQLLKKLIRDLRKVKLNYSK